MNKAEKRAMTSDCSTSVESQQAKILKGDELETSALDELFSNARQNAIESIDCDDPVMDDTYITVEQFQKSRLNLVQDSLMLNLNSNIEHFNKFLDEQFDEGLLRDTLQDVNPSDHYNILYSLLVHYFIDTVTNTDESLLHLIMIIIRSIVVFKTTFIQSNFENKINSIVKTTTSVNYMKIRNSAVNYLTALKKKPSNSSLPTEANLIDTSQESNYHFKSFNELFQVTLTVLNMCNKIMKLATPSTVAFKQIIHTRAESRQNGAKTFKPARRIILDKPILLKLTSRVIGDGFSILSCTEEDSQFIINKLKNSLKFGEENKKIDVNFFPNITIGEFQKKMNVMKFYEFSLNKSVNAINKDMITPDMYIVTDSLNIIYNDSADKFGISVKCWPLKHTIENPYDMSSNVNFCVLDFGYDRNLFSFLEN